MVDRAPVVAPMKDRGIAGLFSDLAREASRLVRQEIALAKAECVDRVVRLGAGAVVLTVGGAILFASLFAFGAAAILALALVLPAWAASLIVGGVTFCVGLGLVLKGRHDMAARGLVPRRTLRTLREDAAWAKEQMR